MKKSPDAFRTISEVAEWLDIPTHVLRFWESRFSQIKPVKRAGGRRYYRPSDMQLIGGVKVLLHDQGTTIRGVQKILREQGVKHVVSFSPPLDGEAAVAVQDDVIEHEPMIAVDVTEPAPAARQTHDAAPAPEPEPEPAPEPDPIPETDAVEVLADEDASEANENQPDMFPDHVSALDAENTPPEPETVPEPAPEPTPSIQLDPDLPVSDPADDAPAYAATPGIAARLATIPTSKLSQNRDALKTARDRLLALSDRLG